MGRGVGWREGGSWGKGGGREKEKKHRMHLWLVI
jgi:hypothetical protein